MTRLIGPRLLLIEPEKPQQCDLCGALAELRPYGPRGECVCYRCGMNDEAAAKQAFFRRLCP